MAYDILPGPGLSKIRQRNASALIQFNVGIKRQEQGPNIGKAEAAADTAANGRQVAELSPYDMACRFFYSSLGIGQQSFMAAKGSESDHGSDFKRVILFFYRIEAKT